jgi:hypothetical protein
LNIFLKGRSWKWYWRILNSSQIWSCRIKRMTHLISLS